MVERWHRWAVVGLGGLAYALRVAGLDFQSLWRDEVDAVRFASQPLGDLLHAFSLPGQNGPLYHFLLHPWLAVAGWSEFALRFSSAFFGVLAVPVAFRVAHRLFPRPGYLALAAALMTATSPYLVWYGQEGKMYSLAVTLALLSTERYLAAIEQGGWPRWLAYVLVTSAAFYVHLLAALLVPAQAISFLLLRRRGRPGQWAPWLTSLAVLTIPYLPLLAWQLPLLFEPANTGYRFVPLQDMLVSLLANYSLGVVQGTTWWALALFGGLLLAGAFLSWRTGAERSASGALLCWLLVPVLVFYLVTLLRPMYTARYLVFVMPAYLLLLAAGLAAIARGSRLLAGLLLGALLAVNGWGLWLQATTPLKADFRAATAYVKQRLAETDLIVFQIPYGRHSFDYYYRQEPVFHVRGGEYRSFLPRLGGSPWEPYRWAEGLYTNGGITETEVDRRMAEICDGSRVVWLVATEVPLWDERGLVQAWLQERASLIEEAHFVRVTVSGYQFR